MKGWDNCPRCGGTGFAGGLLLCNDQQPKERRYIEENWLVYERMVVPRDAGPEQRRDMHDAFFAGALSLMSTLTNEVSTEDDMTPDDMKLMAVLDRELERHGEMVRARAGRGRKPRGAQP